MIKQKLVGREDIIDNELTRSTKIQSEAIKKVIEEIEERMSWRDVIHKIRVYRPTSKDIKRLLEKALFSSDLRSYVVYASGKIKTIDNPDSRRNFPMLCRLKPEKMKEYEIKELAEIKSKYRKAVKQIVEAYAIVEITDSVYSGVYIEEGYRF